MSDNKLRDEVTQLLVERFGPIGMRHYSAVTVSILLDKFIEIADEIIELVQKGDKRE